jgi:hypothetical protein
MVPKLWVGLLKKDMERYHRTSLAVSKEEGRHTLAD